MDAIAIAGAPTPLIFASLLELVFSVGALDIRIVLAVVSCLLKMRDVHLRWCTFLSVGSAFILASRMGWCMALLFALVEYFSPTFGKRARSDLKASVRTRLQEDPELSVRRLKEDEGLSHRDAYSLLREVRAELAADVSDDALKVRVRNLLLADPHLSRRKLESLVGCSWRVAGALLAEVRAELSSHTARASSSADAASAGGVEELEPHIPHLMEHFAGRFFYATELADYIKDTYGVVLGASPLRSFYRITA